MVNKWKKINEKVVKVGFRSFINKNFELPDGRIDQYTIKNEKDVVCIFAITDNDEVVLFKQFRPGPERVFLELPGGGLDDSEDKIDAARRELLEETGYSGDIKYIGTNYYCAYSTGLRHHFVATNCKKVSSQNLDKNEFGEVVLVSLDDFKRLLRDGKLTDVTTGFWALDYLNKL